MARTMAASASRFSIHTVIGTCLILCMVQVVSLVWQQAKNSVLIGEPSSPANKQHRDSSYVDLPNQLKQAIVNSILPLQQTSLDDPFSIVKNSDGSKYSIIPSDDEDLLEQEFVPISPLNASTNAELPHPHAGSRFANGSFGYIADPTRLRRNVLIFDSTDQNKNYTYFDRIRLLQHRYRKGTFTETVPLSHDYVCNLGPGRSFEDEGGFKLLTEKIRIAPTPEQNDSHQRSRASPPPRILCSIYTYQKMRDLARIQALSWGYKCDGFLAFSTETIPALGILEILHAGAESYQNMWQKSRSIWAYIFDHYLDDYDWFHLGGDDLYIIVENMRRNLELVEERQRERNATGGPLFLGSWVKQPGKQPDFVAGAPGYTINREALHQFVTKALHNCSITHAVSHEDRLISKCMYFIGINQSDTRDFETGESQYHDCDPNHLYTFRTGHNPSFHSKIAANWENAMHPKYPTQRVGPKHELEAAATYSIAFHNIYHPTFVARLHSILYPETCPSTSPLGRAMRFYGTVEDGDGRS